LKASTKPDDFTMTQLAGLLKWVLKAAIFFTLFAFALNNQQDATVHFFFGTQWRAPQVLVVLAAFAAGLAIGALGMVPRWWRQRVGQQRTGAAPPTEVAGQSTVNRPDVTLHGL
jgi:uncharacterized integral membrane protein